MIRLKKIKIFWPSVIAIAVAVGVTSCINDNIKNSNEKQKNIDASNYKLVDYKYELEKEELPIIITYEEEDGIYIQKIEEETVKTR